MKRVIVVLLLLFSTLAASDITYDEYDKKLLQGVKQYQLKNGLKVLLLERKKSPTISAFIRFKVGSVDEEYQNTGTAHLLEHMLFKGTDKIGTKDWDREKQILEKIEQVGKTLDYARGQNVAPALLEALQKELAKWQEIHKEFVVKDVYDAIYSRHGSKDFNASTSVDVTTYKVSLPKNKLAVWAYVESERLRNPILREFYLERNVVLEERHMRVVASGRGILYEAFLATAFQAHPYRHPIIGWSSVIPRLQKKATEDFFRKYYVPNNMVVTVVGDIVADEALAVIEKYFGRLQPGPQREPIKIKEPRQNGERRVTVNFHDKPEIVIGYHKPSLPSHEDYVFDVISQLLSEGRSSHLYKELVLEKKMATSLFTSSSFPGSRYPNLFLIWASPAPGVKNELLEKAIYESIQRFQQAKVSGHDLQKVKNQLLASHLHSLNSNQGLASSLGYYELLAGSWKYMLNHRHVIARISSEEIQDVAKRFLVSDNRTVAVLNQVAKKNDITSGVIRK